MTKVLTKTKEDIEETLVNNYIDTEGNNQTEEVIINTVHKDVCTFIFLDEEQLDFQENKVVIKNLDNEVILELMELKRSDYNYYENVTDLPSDWKGCKYKYTPDTGWVLNNDWVDYE